jgi:hypothetical protein
MSAKDTAEAILIVIKRIGKWIAYFAVAIVLIFLVFYAYNKIEEYYQNRPQLVRSIKGIDLDEKFHDFMFRNAGFVLDADRNKKANGVVYYDNKEKSTTVAIEDAKVVRVIYGCTEKFEYTSINGIDCRSSGDSVFVKYDKEIRVQCLKDRADGNFLNYRVYDAIKFGVRYHVVSNEVVAFDIANPAEFNNSEGFMNKKWTACE